MKLSWVALFVMGICSPSFAGPLEDLEAASPAAAALLWQKASDWRKAPQIVKDRAGFMIFETAFPNKAQMSIDDMTACIDKGAASTADTTAVRALVNDCSGIR